jgi:Arc/MetJ-type ribon-helix-helix transcriptional regulator
MKTFTVRLPEAMAAEIESESQAAGISKSDVVRRRLKEAAPRHPVALFDLATDLIGSVDDGRVPSDLSSRKKSYLKSRGYGKSSPR